MLIIYFIKIFYTFKNKNRKFRKKKIKIYDLNLKKNIRIIYIRFNKKKNKLIEKI